jgi:hypothetical protein
MHVDTQSVVVILSSAVFAAIVAGIVSLRTNARNIKVKNVIVERAKWREKVRAKALEIYSRISEGKEAGDLYLQTALILNPLDQEDRAILRLIRRTQGIESKESTISELTDRFALLLKHDWERAKWESSSILGRRLSCPKRVRFEDFKLRRK